LTTTLFPYETLQGDLSLALTAVTVDGGHPTVDVVLPGSRSVDLSVLPRQDWNLVEVEALVTGSADEVRRLEQSSFGLAVCIVAACGPTNMRQATQLKRSATDAARWAGSLLLDRRNFSGKVALSAVMGGEALRRPNRFMSRSQAWSIYVDEPAIPIIEGTMRVKWADFTAPDAEPAALRSYMTEVFYPDLQESAPTLYLNSGFAGLPELLADRRGRPPAEEALHQSERMSIASAVWLGMFNSAVAAIDMDEEDASVDWPLAEWQGSVLKTLLARLYPELGEMERLRLAREAWGSPDGAKVLESMAQMEIGKHIGSAIALRRSLERLQRVDVME
jgi:hypothetical protein